MITKNITCDICGRVLGSTILTEDNIITGYVCGVQLVTHLDGSEIVGTYL